MAHEKKSFFRERSVGEMKKLCSKSVYAGRGLVEKINNLEGGEVLEIRGNILPDRFYGEGVRGFEASRKCYKHGGLIHLDSPSTKRSCFVSSNTPLILRKRAFSKLYEIDEEEIFFIGYSFRPN